MNIILFGYRGSGKTSIGRQLADQLWKTFADVDHEICKRFDNRTVADIWQTDGEPACRKVEVQVTRELVGREEHVIALGGGTLMQAGAREAVEQASDAVRIYLQCEPEVLHKRIEADAQSSGSRPALTPSGGDLDEIKSVLVQRQPVYQAVADHVVDVTELTIDGAVRLLIKQCL